MSTKQQTKRVPMSRQAVCNRLGMEFEDSWVVNLGIGFPTLCSNYLFGDKTIVYQSENGVIGYGPLAMEGEQDPHLVNAAGEYVILMPGGAIVNHADSFSLIRGGHVDVTVLGAYEVTENGDFSNWKTAGAKGGGIGGAMDLAVGAKRVYITMEHTTKDGRPRLLKRCTLPVTAVGVVKLVATTLGLFEVTPQGFLLTEIAPGYTPRDVQALTEAQLIIADDLKEFQGINLS